VKTVWERDTRVCPSIDLQPDLLAAIRDHAERAELGPVEAQALVCFETVSQRTKKPSLTERLAGGGHKTLAQAVIVTPTRFVWAQRAGDGAATGHSQLLDRLDVTDYEKDPAAALLPEHGLQVHGVVAMGGTVGMLFFGLGEGPDADRARRILKEAVRAAHGEGPPVGGPSPDSPSDGAQAAGAGSI